MNKQNNIATIIDNETAEWIEKKSKNEDRSIAQILRRIIRKEMESEKNNDDMHKDIIKNNK